MPSPFGLAMFQQYGDAAASGLLATYWFLIIVLVAISIIASWKIFAKAGEPGWASLIPIYNTYAMIKIVGRPEGLPPSRRRPPVRVSQAAAARQ